VAEEKQQGWTRVPNDFLECLATEKIPIQCWQCLSIIIRLSWGYHRKSAEIRINDFAKWTRLPPSNVIRALKKLKSMKIIKIIPADNKRAKTYRINCKNQFLKQQGRFVTHSDNNLLPAARTNVIRSGNLTPSKPLTGADLRRPKENLKKIKKESANPTKKINDNFSVDSLSDNDSKVFKDEAKRLKDKLEKRAFKQESRI
jgi:phage replication O-like protein O